MSTPASGAQDSSGALRPIFQEDRSVSSHALDPSLLEKVLRETEELLCTDWPPDSREKAALREVARRHRGRPLSLDPVAVDLVQAVVGTRFAARPNSAGFWREMAMHVAQTILDDPLAHDRLDALWSRMGEEGL